MSNFACIFDNQDHIKNFIVTCRMFVVIKNRIVAVGRNNSMSKYRVIEIGITRLALREKWVLNRMPTRELFSMSGTRFL